MLSNCKENIDEVPQPKNVILLISDGAGLSQISSVLKTLQSIILDLEILV